jgi:hypothetical protein
LRPAHPAPRHGRDRALAWHDRFAARTVARRSPDVVHVWPLAATRTIEAARRLGIPAFREVPNTHTANAYEVVALESARLGLDAARRRIARRRPEAAGDRGAGVGDGVRTPGPVGCRRRHVPRARVR